VRRLPPFFALRALEAAARHHSYSRAADELGVTHSAVSQQIRGLQAELGATLFDRCGNHMEPTPAAMNLAAEVRRAINILQSGVDAFASAVTREPLVLSVGGFVAHRWLPPRLPRLLADPAGADLEIRVENRHVDLVNEQVDIGVRFGPGHWEGMDCQRLFNEHVLAVCSPALATERGLSHPRDLLTAPLLHRPSRPWTLWFDHYGLEAPAAIGPVFDDPLMALDAAERGLGVALADESLAADYLEDGRLVSPFDDCLLVDHAIFMLWRRDSRKLARIHALRDWFLAELDAEAAPARIAERRG
jgi:LysR family glycine cleavage system transcriptional activator